MGTYLVKVFYLGTDFCGSQWQPELRTVQGEIISALESWSGESCSLDSVQLAGRTDKGVHSLGQVLMVRTEKILNIDHINRYLPEDIVLWAHAHAPPDFRPRFDVLMRHYKYYLEENRELDINSMRTSLQSLIGSHDFALLSKPDGERGTVTTILNATMTKNHNIITFTFFGTRFLWKLVRKAVAIAVRIGLGELEPHTILKLLDKSPISGGIRPVPPEGLVLIESVIPVRMTRSKYAVRRIHKQIKTRLSFLHRESTTLSILDADLYSDQTFLS